MIEPKLVEESLRAGIADVVHLELRDMTGTKDHYEAVIVAEAFTGVSRVGRHQLVYKALGDLMLGPVHALTMQTLSPAEWEARSR
jgi:stress-induced morphogen